MKKESRQSQHRCIGDIRNRNTTLRILVGPN